MDSELSRRALLAVTAAATATTTPATPAPEVYSRLGIRPVINGVGVVTRLGGSLMHPEVLKAMSEAARCFVPLTELQSKVGARIAELWGAEAAMVTNGCASAITMGTVACVANGEPLIGIELGGLVEIGIEGLFIGLPAARGEDRHVEMEDDADLVVLPFPLGSGGMGERRRGGERRTGRGKPLAAIHIPKKLPSKRTEQRGPDSRRLSGRTGRYPAWCQDSPDGWR